MTDSGHRQPGDSELRHRLDHLARDIEARRARDASAGQARAAQDGSMAQAGRAMSLGFRAITELMVGLGMGAGLGWGIDWLAGTAPLFMIILLFFGMAAGVWNVMRLANSMNAAGDSALAPPVGAAAKTPVSNDPPQAG